MRPRCASFAICWRSTSWGSGCSSGWASICSRRDGRALLYAEPIYLQAERSPMPELRLVELALQDRLAYGPTFESAMAALFGGAVSSMSGAVVPAEPVRGAPASAASPQPAADLNALIAEAAKDLADYQRLTAEGKLGEAGQKLEELKRALDKLNTRQR